MIDFFKKKLFFFCKIIFADCFSFFYDFFFQNGSKFGLVFRKIFSFYFKQKTLFKSYEKF